MLNVILYDTGDTRRENNEPLGIEVIAAKIEAECSRKASVKLLWHNRDDLPCFLTEDIDIIGISLNIKRMDIFDQIYHRLKSRKKVPFIFVGNVVATYGYEYLLQKYPDIICMIGEGEEVFVQIVNDIYEETFRQERINNIAYIEGNKICTTERKIADLDRYVNPHRAFNDFLIQNEGIARIEGSRGCSYSQCNFCSVKYKYDSAKWRPIGIPKIIQQIEEIVSSGMKSIYFTDEDFVGNDPERLQRLIEEVEKRRKTDKAFGQANFFVSVKPIDILNEKIFVLLQKFAQVGLREIFIGIESGCQTQIRRYGKCTSQETNIKALEKAKEIGADIDIGFIMFDPEMTVDELKENIEFAEKCKIYEFGSGFIKKLRIQSFTEYENRFAKENNLKFDLDHLEYFYDFNDSRIAKIYTLYKKRYDETEAYQMQNVYRGEVKTEEAREEQKKQIVELRKKQFFGLKNILREVLGEII